MINPHRCIYTSSYDRGLEHLLKIWPEVKKAVPDVTLDCYYGWQLFEMFYKDNPGSMSWMENIRTQLKQDGIIDHGRIPQDKLVEEYKTSGIFAYPTHFGEINCISAIKAQSYGAIPIVVNYAALKETVQFGIKVNGDIYDKEVLNIYKEQLIWALQHPQWQEEVRTPMMIWARQITWEAIVAQWSDVFNGKIIKPVIPSVEGKVKIVDGYGGEHEEKK